MARRPAFGLETSHKGSQGDLQQRTRKKPATFWKAGIPSNPKKERRRFCGNRPLKRPQTDRRPSERPERRRGLRRCPLCNRCWPVYCGPQWRKRKSRRSQDVKFTRLFGGITQKSSKGTIKKPPPSPENEAPIPTPIPHRAKSRTCPDMPAVPLHRLLQLIRSIHSKVL